MSWDPSQPNDIPIIPRDEWNEKVREVVSNCRRLSDLTPEEVIEPKEWWVNCAPDGYDFVEYNTWDFSIRRDDGME